MDSIERMEQSGADRQEEHEQAGGDGVGVGEPLDALVDATDRGDDEAHGQDGDDQCCGGGAVAVVAEDVGEAAGDLQRSEAEQMADLNRVNARRSWHFGMYRHMHITAVLGWNFYRSFVHRRKGFLLHL